MSILDSDFVPSLLVQVSFVVFIINRLAIIRVIEFTNCFIPKVTSMQIIDYEIGSLLRIVIIVTMAIVANLTYFLMTFITIIAIIVAMKIIVITIICWSCH